MLRASTDRESGFLASEVKYYVAKYSAALAEMYARNHGATGAQIEPARRCLVSNEAAETGQRRSYSE